MDAHINMTKSVLKLLTTLEQSLEQSLDITKDNNAKDDITTEGTEGTNSTNSTDSTNSTEGTEGNNSTNSTKGTDSTKGTNSTDSTDDNNVPLDTGDIGITDFDSICNQLIIKDEIIDKLKSIIINKNEKITKLIRDITETKEKNNYLENKLVELIKNVDNDTLVIL